MSLSVNGVRSKSCRLYTMWRGAWIAELELDPDDTSTLTTTLASSGPASLSIGATTLTGSIDARGTGSFLGKGAARVVGGGGGWDQTVPAQDFHADIGVPSTQVYQQTATLVGETVNDLTPASLGNDVIRSTGPASRVFGAGDWWVGFDGVTNVGARPTPTADASLVIVDFDPLEQRVEFSCDVPLVPGTVLSDPRFNGTNPVVRDVEQVFDAHGSTGTAWCSVNPASRLTSALTNLIIELGTRTYLRARRYRVIQYQGNRLALQAVSSAAGMPDIIPLAQWSGLAGASAKLANGQVVFVGFDHTTAPPQPILLGYALDGLPLESTVDATTAVHIAPTAASVDLAGGGHPIAFGDGVMTELGRIAAAITSLGGAYTPPLPAQISSARGAVG